MHACTVVHFFLRLQRWLASADGRLRLMQPLFLADAGQASWCSRTGRVQLTCCPGSEWGWRDLPFHQNLTHSTESRLRLSGPRRHPYQFAIGRKVSGRHPTLLHSAIRSSDISLFFEPHICICRSNGARLTSTSLSKRVSNPDLHPPSRATQRCDLGAAQGLGIITQFLQQCRDSYDRWQPKTHHEPPAHSRTHSTQLQQPSFDAHAWEPAAVCYRRARHTRFHHC